MPGVTLAELLISIGADTTNAEKGFARVEAALKNAGAKSDEFGSKFKSAGDKAESALGRVGSAAEKEFGRFTSQLSAPIGALGGIAEALGPVGIGLGVVAGLGASAGVALFDLAKSAAETADQYYNLAQKVNFSAHELSGLTVIGAQAGVEFSSVSTGLGLFDKKLEEANEKSTALGRVLKANSVDTHDNQKALEGLFTILAKLPDGIVQNKLAVEAFGKGGKEMLGLVKQAHGDLPTLIKLLDDMSATISNKDAKAAHEFDAKLQLLEQQFDVAKVKVGNELLPVLGNLFDSLSSWLARNEGELRAWGETFASVASAIISSVSAIKSAISSVSSITPSAAADVHAGTQQSYARQAWNWLWKSDDASEWERGTGQATFHMMSPEETAAVARQNKSDEAARQALAAQTSKLLGGGGKGKGGHRGKQPKDLTSLREQLATAEGGLRLADIGFDTNKFKSELDSEQSILGAAFNAQLVSVKSYWQSRSEITLAGLDKEISQVEKQRMEAARTYSDRQVAITEDTKISPQEKSLKLQVEAAKYSEKDVQLQGQLVELTNKRVTAAQTLTFEAAAANRELQKTMASLHADALESGGDDYGAAKVRIDEKYKDFERLAKANKTLYPDAEKWVAQLEKADQLSAHIAEQQSKVGVTKGYLSLETAGIQDRITDGIISQRDGLKEINNLEIKYREQLRGELEELLANARARAGIKGDQDSAVLAIKQMIEETKRLGHEIDQVKQQARGIFKDSFSHGLDELRGGLKHAAATFGLDLADGVRKALEQNLTNKLAQILFGKNDQFGGDNGLIGKALNAIGLGGLLGNKDAGKATEQAANTDALINQTVSLDANAASLDVAAISTDTNTISLDANTFALQELSFAVQSSGGGGDSGGGGGLGSALAGLFSGGGGGDAPGGLGDAFAGGFKGGGSFIVGGSPGTDANLVSLRATRGERVTVETPEQQRRGTTSGGHTFQISFHIDARGSHGVEDMLSRETQNQIEHRMRMLMHRASAFAYPQQ